MSRRRGKPGVKVSIDIELDSQPQLWLLSDGLSALLGLKLASRAEVLQSLWAHIRLHKLQVSNLSSRPVKEMHQVQRTLLIFPLFSSLE